MLGAKHIHQTSDEYGKIEVIDYMYQIRAIHFANETINSNSDMLFPVVDERRMQNREIHFINHPMAGIIVLNTPYEIVDHSDNTKKQLYNTIKR